MLFEPLRTRQLNFLEMGLFIGGPEHGVDKDRVTTDLPSIKMWLEYFPKSHIHGLDISDLYLSASLPAPCNTPVTFPSC